jgi:hypothetical protein
MSVIKFLRRFVNNQRVDFFFVKKQLKWRSHSHARINGQLQKEILPESQECLLLSFRVLWLTLKVTRFLVVERIS